MSHRCRSGAAASQHLCSGALVIALAAAACVPAEPPPRLAAETVAARQHYFGAENVDPQTGSVRGDRAILSWTGVSSFAAAFAGHVVLLDAWIPRGRPCYPHLRSRDSDELDVQFSVCARGWPHSMAYVGTTDRELAALAPEAYFFGHGHFDHAGDLPTVLAANPGMTVFGTREHCDDISGETELDLPPFECVAVVEARAAMGSTAELPPDALPGVAITAVKQPHASPAPEDARFGYPRFPADETCPQIVSFASGPDEPLSWLGRTGGSTSLAWQFRIGELAVTWQDTAGPIRSGVKYSSFGLTYDGAQVSGAFRNLEPTDVRLASVVLTEKSALLDHLAALGDPEVLVPLHGDPCFGSMHPELQAYLRENLPETRRPALRLLRDPEDYLRPLVFDPSSPRWVD